MKRLGKYAGVNLLMVVATGWVLTSCNFSKGLSKQVVGTSAITAAEPEIVGVQVISPAAGEKVFSAVHVIANSVPDVLQGGSIQVSIDGTPVAQTFLDTLDQYFPVTAGSHQVVINGYDSANNLITTRQIAVETPADACDGTLPNANDSTFPPKLSQTCLFANLAQLKVNDVIRPYEPQYKLWSDGEEKKRWIYLPPGTKIDTSDMDGWNFPVGTRLFKHFMVGTKSVETRMFVKVMAARDNASWAVGTYMWANDQSDADFITTGMDNVNGTNHQIPTIAQCLRCHQGSKDLPLGMDALQMSIPFTKGLIAMDVLKGENLLTAPPAAPIAIQGTPKGRAAMGYMHANCASCHSAVGTMSSIIYRHNLDATSTETENVYLNTVVSATQRIVPGSAATSRVYIRMSARPGMPALGSKIIDPVGLATIEAWINELGGI